MSFVKHDMSETSSGAYTRFEQAIITGLLDTRPLRAPDFEGENRALRSLARKINESPDIFLSELSKMAAELCGCASAGVSMVEVKDGIETLRCRAAVGKLSSLLNFSIPRSEGTSGMVMDKDSIQLLHRPRRHHQYADDLKYPVEELLIIPFSHKQRVVGTVWVASHSPEKEFDSEDARILSSLAEFASSAFQMEGERSRDFNKRKLENFFHESPAPLCFLRGDNLVFEMVNPGYQALFPGRELLGKALTEAVPELIGQEFPGELRKVLRTGEKFYGYDSLVKLAKSVGSEVSEYYFDIVYSRVDGPDGEPYGVFAYAQDVTELKLAIMESERSREQLHSFFMQAPLPMIILEGPDHRFTLANSHYEKLVGMKVLGKTVGEALGMDIEKEFVPILDKVYKTGIPYVGNEVAFELPNEGGSRERRWVNFGYHPFKNAKNEIMGILAIIEDVTDSFKAKHDLLTKKKKLEVIVAESASAIGLMRGPDLIFERVNSKWQELVSEREYIGKAYADIYPELVGTAAEASLMHTFETGEPFVATEMKLEIRSDLNDLPYQYFDYRNVRILDGEGKPYGVYCHAQNVTDRVVSRENLLQQAVTLATAVDKLEEEREIRERFVTALTHDLRTPMTAAKISAQLAGKKANDQDAVKRLTGRVVVSIDRADRMIQDLLDANRLKAGDGVPIRCIECVLDDIIGSAVKDFEELHGKRFRVKIDPGSIFGFWDPNYIQRVLENLVANAIKYGAQETDITVGAQVDGSRVRISVHNFGEAIRSDDQRTLFNAYQRTSSALKSGHKGWGIGLALVKGIAEAHNGTVRLESHPATGTTFFIDLPLDSRIKA